MGGMRLEWRRLGFVLLWIAPIAIGAWLGMTGATGQEPAAATPTIADWDLLQSVHDMVKAGYVTPVEEERLERGAVQGLLHELDPFSEYFTPEDAEDLTRGVNGSFVGIGVQISEENGLITVISPLEDSPAMKAGINPGDIILEVNGQPLHGMTATDVAKRVRGAIGTDVKVKVFSKLDQVEKTYDMKREKIDLVSIKDITRYGDGKNILYFRLTDFQANTAQQFDEKIAPLVNDADEGVRALIIDLRFNPGGDLEACLELCDRFVSDGALVSVKGRTPELSQEFSARKRNDIRAVPVVILINEGSASASELFSGCLQDHKLATVIGERSFGKGSVQRLFPMDEAGDGGLLKLTVAHYYTPSGRCVHRTEQDRGGILPDKELPLAAEDMKKLLDALRQRSRGQEVERYMDPQLVEAIRVAGEKIAPAGEAK